MLTYLEVPGFTTVSALLSFFALALFSALLPCPQALLFPSSSLVLSMRLLLLGPWTSVWSPCSLFNPSFFQDLPGLALILVPVAVPLVPGQADLVTLPSWTPCLTTPLLALSVPSQLFCSLAVPLSWLWALAHSIVNPVNISWHLLCACVSHIVVVRGEVVTKIRNTWSITRTAMSDGFWWCHFPKNTGSFLT